VQNRVRTIGINPNHWYAVAWAKVLKPGQILPIQIWHEQMALYRDTQGQVQAVQDVCPHKGVAMHTGELKGDHIVCGYHGWEFDRQGKCVDIPYFPPTQKLPRACLKTYPVIQRYGLIFVFPGDRTLAAATPLIDIPQYDDPDWVMVPISAQFQAHFTICNENTMDVFHGYLHRNLQGWFNPMLLKLSETEDRIEADYQVSYQGLLTRFLGLNQSDRTATRVISISYHYPNYISSLQGVSYLYLMRLPVSCSESRSFTLLFLKLRMPRWLRDRLLPVLEPAIRDLLFMRFIRQDIEMIESEYKNYLSHPDRRYVEVNPAIIAVQRLMMKQYDNFRALNPGNADPGNDDSSSSNGANFVSQTA
jgi:nitrite reductase/ring-hydroxylating ferredoxin subunit